MDLSNLQFLDLQYILAVRFCLLAFLLLGVFCIYKQVKPVWFLLFTGALTALSYFLFMNDLPLMFWGLQGDEVTLAAMYNTFAHASFFSDFAYLNLPPFYPPFFFWIFALVGKIFDWNGVQMAKFASGVSMTVFPLLAYGIQQLYAKFTPEREEKSWNPSTIAFFVAPLLVFLFIDWDAFILKPYEVLCAFFSILWVAYLGLDAYYHRLNFKRILVYGVSGGILFLTYYLWLVFGALALALFALTVKKENQYYYYSRLFVTALLVFAVASPYIVPLVLSYQKFGSQNFQMGYFAIQHARLYAVMFEFFSWRGIFLLAGFISLLVFRHIQYIRLLISFFLAFYIWYLIGLFTLFFFAASNQEFKGFYIVDRVLLALALAYALERLWLYIEQKKFVYDWKRPALLLGLFYLSSQMIFGFFMNDSVVLARRDVLKNVDTQMITLSQFLNQDAKKVNTRPMVLQSGIPHLFAFSPINSFLYYNIHNSHPAAMASKRQAYVTFLSFARNPKELADLSKNSPYGTIGRFIFFQYANKTDYQINFSIDNFPHGASDVTLSLPKKLFREPYFKKVYENAEFVVFDLNTDAL